MKISQAQSPFSTITKMRIGGAPAKKNEVGKKKEKIYQQLNNSELSRY